MPELELETEKKPHKEIVKSDTDKETDELIGDLLNTSFVSEKTTSKLEKSISHGYEILDDIDKDNIEKNHGLKEFLENLKSPINALATENKDSYLFNDINKTIKDGEIKITELIEKESPKEKIVYELKTILDRIDEVVKKINYSKSQARGKTNQTLHFKKIDKLYEELYKSINNNKPKKVSLYRGRLIRELKKSKSEINKLYEEVKDLETIKNILEKTNNTEEIKEIIQKHSNDKEYQMLINTLKSQEIFKVVFTNIYNQKQVRRILLYKNALKEELKNQRKDYQKRYETEFLDKRGDLITAVKSFPTAIALSIKSVANSINEMKEAETNRMKVRKFIDTLKGMGKVMITPAICTGKFVASNWYTILKLYKGYQAKQEQKELENEIDEQTNKNENHDIEEPEKNEDGQLKTNSEELESNNEEQNSLSEALKEEAAENEQNTPAIPDTDIDPEPQADSNESSSYVEEDESSTVTPNSHGSVFVPSFGPFGLISGDLIEFARDRDKYTPLVEGDESPFSLRGEIPKSL